MRRGYLLLVCMLAVAACKKKDNRPYSVWYINGERFASNNVSAERSFSGSSLECDDENGFYFRFPYDRSSRIFSSGSRFYASSCYFAFHGKSLQAPYDTFFYCHYTNAPGQFTIDTAWVYNYQFGDTTHTKRDSALLWGAFIIPE